jgi:uncharacterized protein YndB with AHSA1/START domain
MDFTYSIEIDRTPQSVFTWIEQPEKARLWQTTVAATELLHESPGMVGTTFREVVAVGGRGLEMLGVVTRYEAHKAIAFHLDSRNHSLDVDDRVEPCAHGAQVTMRADVHWKFPMSIVSLFIGTRLRRNLLSEAQTEFTKLKQLAQGTEA